MKRPIGVFWYSEGGKADCLPFFALSFSRLSFSVNCSSAINDDGKPPYRGGFPFALCGPLWWPIGGFSMRGSIGTWASRQSRHREPQRARDTAASMGAGERGARASMGAGNTGQSRQRWKLYRWTQPGAGDGQAPKHSRQSAGNVGKIGIPSIWRFKGHRSAFNARWYSYPLNVSNVPQRATGAATKGIPRRGIEGSAHRPREWLEYPEKIKRPI